MVTIPVRRIAGALALAMIISGSPAMAQIVPARVDADPAGCENLSFPISQEVAKDIEGDASLLALTNIVLANVQPGSKYLRHIVITPENTITDQEPAADELKKHPNDPEAQRRWRAVFCPHTQ